MRQADLDIVAVYHSHPTSDPVPSKKDRERNYSEEVINLIVSLKLREVLVRGWWLTEESHREAEWEIIEPPAGRAASLSSPGTSGIQVP